MRLLGCNFIADHVKSSKSRHDGVVLVTHSRERSSFVASGDSVTSTLRVTGANTGRQAPGPAVPSSVPVWGRVVQAFDSLVIRPLKTSIRHERDATERRRMDHGELRYNGINRTDAAAIRASTYTCASSNDAGKLLASFT